MSGDSFSDWTHLNTIENNPQTINPLILLASAAVSAEHPVVLPSSNEEPLRHPTPVPAPIPSPANSIELPILSPAYPPTYSPAVSDHFTLPIRSPSPQQENIPPTPFHEHFPTPTCVLVNPGIHPHQYTVINTGDIDAWRPQSEFTETEFLSTIPEIDELLNPFPHVLAFRHRAVHHVQVLATKSTLARQLALPPVFICNNVGFRAPSKHFPLGYLEYSYKCSIRATFRAASSLAREAFELSLVPLTVYDLLDGRMVTIYGRLWFHLDNVYLENRGTLICDAIRTRPHLLQYTLSPRVPANPVPYLTSVPPINIPL